MALGTQELVIVLLLALLMFGGRKLPELAKAIGESLNTFKKTQEDYKSAKEEPKK
jgi:sec-independent protein translocase protein TatA